MPIKLLIADDHEIVRHGLAEVFKDSPVRIVGSAQTGGEIVVSQADLAEMIGVTRKAVNGWLGALEGQGRVARGYGVITVLDRAGLERMLA